MKYRMDEITESCLGKMLDSKKNKGEYQPYLANINVRWGSFDLNNLSLMRFEPNENDRYGIKYGDLIMCEGGEPGRCAIWRDELPNMKIQKALHRIRPNTNLVDVEYLYYWFLLSGKNDLLRRHFTETTIKHLPGETLKQLVIDLPDMKIQKNISTVLRSIDKKITVNEKINDNLEQQAKLIYDYWFTQFDFPDENGKPYCSSGGKMVWNEQLKRNIPENWNVVPLLKLVSWESNSQPPKSEFVYEPKEGYVRFIQNRDYDSDTHITYIPRTKNLSIVNRFDILMDKYGDAGAVRYGIEGAFNVALGKICVHNPNYREYIRSFLGSDGIYKFLHNSCMASTRASLSEANLAILNVVVPDEKIILDYENFLHKIRVSILKNKDETVELINLRDWLLPMLMNGQATIAD